MSRDPIVIDMSVPFEDVDEAFEWWMRQYERDSDGQFYSIAKQLQPHVTVSAYARWRSQFEYPKGETWMMVIRGVGPHPDPATLCQQHERPKALGYCE